MQVSNSNGVIVFSLLSSQLSYWRKPWVFGQPSNENDLKRIEWRNFAFTNDERGFG